MAFLETPRFPDEVAANIERRLQALEARRAMLNSGWREGRLETYSDQKLLAIAQAEPGFSLAPWRRARRGPPTMRADGSPWPGSKQRVDEMNAGASAGVDSGTNEEA